MTKKTPLPISVCIITGDETERHRSALDSIVGRTTALIVVISDDSHDGTDEIAKSLGAKVIHEPGQGNFGQQNSLRPRRQAMRFLAGRKRRL